MIIRFNNSRVILRNKQSRFIIIPSSTIGTVYLNLTVNDESLGYVIGSGRYKKDSTVEIQAVESDIGRFLQWSDGNINATRTITLDQNKSLQAIFESRQNFNGILTRNNELIQTMDDFIIEYR